jgi:resolvase-like protein/DUF2971 family protein
LQRLAAATFQFWEFNDWSGNRYGDPKMKIEIYTRVSTDDKGQDPQNQFIHLRDFASKQEGWKITHYYNDQATGKNGGKLWRKTIGKSRSRRRRTQKSKPRPNPTCAMVDHVSMATAPSVSAVPPIPKRATQRFLYKYFSLDHRHEDEHKVRLGWLEKIVLNHQLYVPSLTELNDPAEGRPRLTALSEQQLHAFLLGPQQRIGRVLDGMILDVNIPLHTPQKLLRSMSDILFDQLKDTKIYSLTKHPTNMGMWAKYADDHCGYCLEFANEGDFFGQAKEVIYTDAELDISKREQIGGWFFFCKGNDWSSEEEIRIHASRNNPHEAIIDPQVLTSIILGWKMPEPDRTLIRQWAKQRRPELTVKTAIWDAYEGKLNIRGTE